MATLLDWGQVAEITSAIQMSLGLEKPSHAFQVLALDIISGLPQEEALSAITDGGHDRGIDAIVIEDSFGKRTVHFYQFKYVSTFEKTSNNFPSSEIDKVLSFLSDLFSKSDGMVETCNSALYSKVQAIWELIEQEVFDYAIHFVSNCSALVQDQRERFEAALKPYKRIVFYEYPLEKVSSLIIGKQNRIIEKKLHFLDDQIFERSDGSMRGLIGTIKGESLINFIVQEDNADELNPWIFEDNVRIYLGERNEVNRKIFDTAVSERGAEFWYLNNGITIVCEEFQYQPGLSSPIVHVKNPQVVNGGQTSHSLFQASKLEGNSVKHVRVLTRLIETKDHTFTNRVAEATNSQTPIRSRDLRSNDQVQLKIEKALKARGLFYERKKNQYQNNLASERVDALRLGQLILAYYFREPDKSKTQSDKIFGEMYELVFDPDTISIEKIETVIRLYSVLQEQRNLATHLLRSSIGDSYDEAWIVEGIYHVLFVVASLCDRDAVDPANYNHAIERLSEALKLISDFVKSQKTASAYRIFRSSKTRNWLLGFKQPKQLSLF